MYGNNIWASSLHQHWADQTHTPQDKESSIVTDGMTAYHALCPPPDVHRRRSASKWTHRQTLAQTGCSGTDRTLFPAPLRASESAAARKLSDTQTDLRRANVRVLKAIVFSVKIQGFFVFKYDTDLRFPEEVGTKRNPVTQALPCTQTRKRFRLKDGWS